jgi:hypothetical protein
MALRSWRRLVGFRRKFPDGHCYRYSRRDPLARIGTANLAVSVEDGTLMDGFAAVRYNQIACVMRRWRSSQKSSRAMQCRPQVGPVGVELRDAWRAESTCLPLSDAKA